MKKTLQNFRYVELIIPITIPEVGSLIGRCDNRTGRARKICKWVASTIEDSKTGTDVKKILVSKKGTCLGKCALAVSLLRSLAFTEEEVFVAILAKKGKNPFETLHALVYFQCEEVFFDLTGGFHEYDKSLEEASTSNILILMFNDKICLVP